MFVELTRTITPLPDISRFYIGRTLTYSEVMIDSLIAKFTKCDLIVQNDVNLLNVTHCVEQHVLKMAFLDFPIKKMNYMCHTRILYPTPSILH